MDVAAPTVAHVKTPPHSLEAERCVLGGLMIDNDMWDRVSEHILESDFYRPDHRLIFRKISSLFAAGTPFDVITVCDALENEGKLEHAGGLSYLSELANNTPSVSNVGAYAQIVHEKSVLRQLLSASSEVVDKIYFPEGASTQDILDLAEQKVFAIAEHGQDVTGPEAVSKIMPELVDKLDQLMKLPNGISGLPTRYHDLDKITAGLQPADMVVLAGRPSMGKTLLAMNIAENVAMESEKPVLVFSLEMPKDALMMRVLSSLGRVPQGGLRTGELSEHEWGKVFSTMSLCSEKMNLFIDDTPALTPAEMRSRARKMARENGGLSLIVIDYLQLMRVPGNNESRVNEVSEISRSIKALAKELNVPIIAISQLSRRLEERTDKRPMNSDLRESGAIEQDADVIMFIYRDEVYHPETEYKGTAELIIGKHRNGPIGMLRLTFLGQYCRFDDYAPQRMN